MNLVRFCYDLCHFTTVHIFAYLFNRILFLLYNKISFLFLSLSSEHQPAVSSKSSHFATKVSEDPYNFFLYSG